MRKRVIHFCVHLSFFRLEFTSDTHTSSKRRKEYMYEFPLLHHLWCFWYGTIVIKYFFWCVIKYHMHIHTATQLATCSNFVISLYSFVVAAVGGVSCRVFKPHNKHNMWPHKHTRTHRKILRHAIAQSMPRLQCVSVCNLNSFCCWFCTRERAEKKQRAQSENRQQFIIHFDVINDLCECVLISCLRKVNYACLAGVGQNQPEIWAYYSRNIVCELCML